MLVPLVLEVRVRTPPTFENVTLFQIKKIKNIETYLLRVSLVHLAYREISNAH